MNNSKNHIWTGLFIAIGLTVLGFFILQSARVMRFSNRYVNVKGLAEKEVKADVAIWPITDRKSTRLNSSHTDISRMPSSA